jgi:ketosteroid isomerase-like protein
MPATIAAIFESVVVQSSIGATAEREQAMTEPSPSRLQLAQKFMAAIGRSDVDGAIPLLSPTATYRVEGDHSLSGTFTANEVVDHLLTMIARTAGTFDVTKFDDWLIGEHYAACIVEVTFHAEGRRFSGQTMFLLRFDLVNLIEKVSVFFEDTDAISRFFG